MLPNQQDNLEAMANPPFQAEQPQPQEQAERLNPPMDLDSPKLREMLLKEAREWWKENYPTVETWIVESRVNRTLQMAKMLVEQGMTPEQSLVEAQQEILMPAEPLFPQTAQDETEEQGLLNLDPEQ